MKRLIFKTGTFLALLLLVTSCKEDLIMFDDSMNFVGFSATSLSIKENAASGSVTVYLGAPAGTANVTVVLETSVTNIAKPAIEGTDYTISTKSLNVPVGTAAVTITPIDNAVYEGNKSFYLTIKSNSADYKLAAQKTVTVTLVDDEHPLKVWIGTYTVAAASVTMPGDWDETWTVTTSAISGSDTKLNFVGISGGTTPVVGTLNKTALTISMASAQPLGSIYGYTSGKIYYGTDAVLAGIGASAWIPVANLTSSADVPMNGTLTAGGGIVIPNMCPVCFNSAATGFFTWDAFNTTWTKN